MKIKGKNSFTSQAIKEIRQILVEKNIAPELKQMGFRKKLREKGFYISDFGMTGFTAKDLDRLIMEGRITVTDGPEITPIPSEQVMVSIEAIHGLKEVDDKLVKGKFTPMSEMSESMVPAVSGLYCIKLRKGIVLPAKFGKIREDGIIYIGQGENLRKRLWKNELNHQGHGTFFRGIGAILGYLPPKGSLIGMKNQNNYVFSPEDTKKIIQWMRVSLLVSFVHVEQKDLDEYEKKLIGKYCPLMNNKHNPLKSFALEEARAKCRAYAQG